jgi:hypothetical protein
MYEKRLIVLILLTSLLTINILWIVFPLYPLPTASKVTGKYITTLPVVYFSVVEDGRLVNGTYHSIGSFDGIPLPLKEVDNYDYIIFNTKVYGKDVEKVLSNTKLIVIDWYGTSGLISGGAGYVSFFKAQDISPSSDKEIESAGNHLRFNAIQNGVIHIGFKNDRNNVSLELMLEKGVIFYSYSYNYTYTGLGLTYNYNVLVTIRYYGEIPIYREYYDYELQGGG